MADSTVRVVFMGDSNDAQRAVKGLDGRVGALDNSMRNLKRGAAIGFAAIAGAIVLAEKSAIGFDRAMRNVNSIGKDNTKTVKEQERALQALEKRVLALAKTTGQSATVLADGLYEIVSSGFKANDAMVILKQSAIAATAGMTDTATASGAIVAALNAWQLPASQAKNVASDLFKTVQLGVVTFPQLAQQMGDLTALAPSMGVSLQEATAAFAELTKQGGPAAEHATRFKGVLAGLMKPSKDLAAVTRDLGYENTQAGVKALGLAGFLNKVFVATKDTKGAAGKLFPDIRAMAGYLGLTGKHAKETAGFTRQMNKAFQDGNEQTKAFAEMGKSIAVQWGKAQAQLDAAGIKLGTTLFPALITGIGYLSKMAGWLDKLAGKHDIQAKVSFVADSALGVGSLVKDLLFGKTTVKPITVPMRVAMGTGAYAERTTQTQGLVQSIAASVKSGIDSADWSKIGKSLSDKVGDSVSKAGKDKSFRSEALGWYVSISRGFDAAKDEGARAIGALLGRGIRAGVTAALNLRPGDIGPAARALGAVVLQTLETTLGASFGFITGLVEGVLGTRFKGSIRKLIASIPGEMKSAAKGVPGAAEWVAHQIVDGIKKAPGYLVGLAGDLGAKIQPALSQAGTDAYTWALGIGAKIAKGVLDGLKGLPGKILAAVTPGGGKHTDVNPKPVPTGKAAGDRIDGPMLAMIGEDAPAHPEWVIPSNPRYRSRALGLLAQATAALGVPGFAAGGGPGSGHHYTGHQTRGRKAPRLASVVGAAATSMSTLKAAQQTVQDLGRSYDQADRAFGATDESFTTEVPDDPTDPTNTSTHSVLNQPGIDARVAELTDLMSRKNGILAALETERKAIEDAISKVQAAIAALLKSIKDLQEKAKKEAADARNEHALAATASASVNKKGGLQDQVTAERNKKKPSQSVINRLEAQIKDAGRSHDSHEASATRHETYQGRYSQQAQDKAGKVSDLRGTLSDLMTNRHDLPFDVKDQQIDLQYLQAEIARDRATSVAAFVLGPKDVGGGGGPASTIAESISSDVLQQLQQYRDALGLSSAQRSVIDSMPSFQRGTLTVPNDMVAYLHAGEGVRTADQHASDLRQAGNTGPISVHIQGVVVTDQMDVWLEQNGKRLSAQVISDIGRSADILRRSNRTA